MKRLILPLLSIVCLITSCQEPNQKPERPDLAEEYYTGGKLGTSFWHGTDCFEQPTPAVEEQGMSADFVRGEAFFEDPFVTTNPEESPMGGLGPAYVRASCMHCHPGYGHGKRIEGEFNVRDHGNGYLLCVHTGDEDNWSYVKSLSGMPQTMASHPFEKYPPIDGSQINIKWHEHVDQFGNTYPDGEKYSLIYPEVTIPESAYNVIPVEGENIADWKVAIEATIGIYGTGLIDAITDADLRAEYANQQSRGYAAGRIGKDITENDGTVHPGRYTYGLTRGTLQNGAGSNAIWNITNVTRKDRQFHYIPDSWINFLKTTPEYASNEEFKNATDALVGSNLPDANLPVEFEQDDYIDFMVWHRGLAVPSARDLDNPEVKRGKELFYSKELGCTACHKPSWTTGSDEYTGDKNLTGNELPRYPHQKIWPYTDLLQHNLEMKEPGLRKWCRTTPLWGRGLHMKATGASEHMHDMRARSYEEAILWHEGEALQGKKAFRNLSKSDREAMISFLKAI